MEQFFEDKRDNFVPKISQMKKDDREEKFKSLLDFAMAQCPFDF